MKFQSNTLSLYYSRTGEGPPLFLLHGNGEDHTIFNEIATDLSNHFTVYAIDSRNHGQSQMTDDFSYTTMSKDLFDMIKGLLLDKVTIIGFSDGAITGLLLAIHHPDVVDKLILLGANLDPNDFKDDIFEELLQSYKDNPNPLLRLMIEEPSISTDDLKKVQSPTLVVGAEHDIFKPDTFINISKWIPNSELLIVKNHTHDSYIVQTSILYPEISHFLLKE